MAGASQNDDDELITGINVTPLVDVVLVLLVIFMITAPTIFQSAIKVNLPKAQSAGEAAGQTPLQFTVAKDGLVYWGAEKLSWEELDRRLRDKPPANLDENVSISADESTPHGTVVKLMDVLRRNGLHRFALTVQSGQ